MRGLGCRILVACVSGLYDFSWQVEGSVLNPKPLGDPRIRYSLASPVTP